MRSGRWTHVHVVKEREQAPLAMQGAPTAYNPDIKLTGPLVRHLRLGDRKPSLRLVFERVHAFDVSWNTTAIFSVSKS